MFALLLIIKDFHFIIFHNLRLFNLIKEYLTKRNLDFKNGKKRLTSFMPS